MITLIAAIDEHRGLGKDGELLFHLREDLQRFKRLTMGKPLIMGRKTFASLPGILPGRPHIVITHRTDWTIDDERVTICHSIEEALALVQEQDAFVIGGGEIYRAFFPYAHRLELTEIHAVKEADTIFPDVDHTWQEVARDSHPSHTPPYDFVTYIRQSSCEA